MSLQDVADVMRYSKAEGLDKWILVCLANYTDEKRECWPSVGRLAKDAGVSDRTIQRTVQVLVELGELTKVERQRENGSDTSNIYRVTISHPPGVTESPPPVSQSHPQILSVRSTSSMKEEGILPKARPKDQEEVISYCESIRLTDDDGAFFWNKWVANGFTNNRQSIRDWKAVIRSWKAAGWVPSQKSRKNGKNGYEFNPNSVSV